MPLLFCDFLPPRSVHFMNDLHHAQALLVDSKIAVYCVFTTPLLEYDFQTTARIIFPLLLCEQYTISFQIMQGQKNVSCETLAKCHTFV